VALSNAGLRAVDRRVHGPCACLPGLCTHLPA